MSRSRSPPRALESYESWLRSHGVTWDFRLRLQHLGVSGWGLVATQHIPSGRAPVICVPRQAALTSAATTLGGRSLEDVLREKLPELAKFDETRDSQLPLVPGHRPSMFWGPRFFLSGCVFRVKVYYVVRFPGQENTHLDNQCPITPKYSLMIAFIYRFIYCQFI